MLPRVINERKAVSSVKDEMTRLEEEAAIGGAVLRGFDEEFKMLSTRECRVGWGWTDENGTTKAVCPEFIS